MGKKCFECGKIVDIDELLFVDNLVEKLGEFKEYEDYSDYFVDSYGSKDKFHNNRHLDYEGVVNVCEKCFYKVLKKFNPKLVIKFQQKQCVAITKKGSRCSHAVAKGNKKFCNHHSKR